jgi:hypothetical protein
MELTKQEKHELYSIALKQLEENPKNNLYCCCINIVSLRCMISIFVESFN